MSQTARPTSLFARIVNNLVERNRKTGEETLVGVDYLGNKYYEQVGANVQERRVNGVELPKRWYFPRTEHQEDWDQYVPPEWEAWMRYRRIEAPTEDEINLNLAVAHMKQLNAAKLAEEQRKMHESAPAALPVQPDHTATSLKPLKQDAESEEPVIYNKETGENARIKFPVYEDYESHPHLGVGHRQRKIDRNNPFID